MVRRIPYNLFGYAYVSVGGKALPSVDEDQAEVVKKVFALFTKERYSFNQIAQKVRTDTTLDKQAKATITRVQVSRILARPEYAGLCRDKKGGIHASLMFPRIIDFYTWSKTQMQLGRRSFDNREGDARLKFPLSGQIHCTHCKASYYRHDTRYYAHKCYESDEPCPYNNDYIPKKMIEEYVISIIFDIATDESLSGVLLDCIRAQKAALRKLFPNAVELTYQISEVNRLLEGLSPSSKERDRQKMVLKSLQGLEDETPEAVPGDIQVEAETIRNRVANLALFGNLNRLELIDFFVEDIAIHERTAIVSLRDGHRRRVTLAKMQEKTQKLLGQSLNKRYSSLRDIYGYRSAKAHIQVPQEAVEDDEMRRELYEIKKVQVANGKSSPFKAYLPQGTMVSTTNVNHSIYLDDVYQWNLDGEYFVDLAGKEVSTTVFSNGYHLAIVVLDELFINRAWLHTAPSTIKSGAIEYFAYDGKYLIFARDRKSIWAYDYAGFQRREEMPMTDAIAALVSAKDIKFFDL